MAIFDKINHIAMLMRNLYFSRDIYDVDDRLTHFT